MKTVTLLSFIGSENLGDEAINFSILKKFSGTQHKVLIISFNPQKTSKLAQEAGLKSFSIIKVTNFKEIKSAISLSDALVCGGGGIIQDQTSIYNLPFFLFFINYAIRKKKKIMLYAVGVGPLYSPLLKFYTRRILEKIDVITVRDNTSKETLESLGIPSSKVIVTADPVLNLIPGDPIELPLDREASTVIICLRKWFDTYRFLPVSVSKKLQKLFKKKNRKFQAFIDELAKALDEIDTKHEIQFVYLPFWASRDSEAHKFLISKLKTNTQNVLIEKEIGPSQALGLIKNADLVIGMRLHSLIFAAMLGKNFVAINYSPKVKSFLQLFMRDELVQRLCLNPQNINKEDLVAMIEFALNEDPFVNMTSITQLRKMEDKNFLYLQDLLNI